MKNSSRIKDPRPVLIHLKYNSKIITATKIPFKLIHVKPS